MNSDLNINGIYATADNVISRKIETELVIVPLEDGIGKLDDCLFSLNETGKEIWRLLDGTLPVTAIIDILTEKYNAPRETIASDVTALVGKLLYKGLVREIKP
jgi:hypothetical protein